MRITRRLTVLLICVLFVLSACSSPTSSQPSPTPQQTTKTSSPTSNQSKPASSEDWKALNRWLSELYGLPPVSNTEQLKSAAFVVSGIWYKQANKAISKMEQNNIPWSKAASSYASFNYYVLHDAQLNSVSDPIEFMAV